MGGGEVRRCGDATRADYQPRAQSRPQRGGIRQRAPTSSRSGESATPCPTTHHCIALHGLASPPHLKRQTLCRRNSNMCGSPLLQLNNSNDAQSRIHSTERAAQRITASKTQIASASESHRQSASLLQSAKRISTRIVPRRESAAVLAASQEDGRMHWNAVLPILREGIRFGGAPFEARSDRNSSAQARSEMRESLHLFGRVILAKELQQSVLADQMSRTENDEIGLIRLEKLLDLDRHLLVAVVEELDEQRLRLRRVFR